MNGKRTTLPQGQGSPFELLTQMGEKRKIAIVLLDSKSLKQDTQNILNWLNKNYFVSSPVE